MSGALAVGVPHRLGGGPFDWTPLIAAVAAIAMARIVFHVRLTIPVVVLAFAGGLLFASASERWGLPLSISAVLLIVVLISLLARRSQPR